MKVGPWETTTLRKIRDRIEKRSHQREWKFRQDVIRKLWVGRVLREYEVKPEEVHWIC